MKRFWMLLWMLCAASFSGAAQSLPRFIPYKTKAGWGYSDSNKKMLIAPRFQSAGLFWNGRAPVTVKKANGSEANCLIDTNGNFVVPPEWNWTGGISNDRFNIHDSLGRWGLINVMGKMLIEPRFQRANYFQSNYRTQPQELYAFVWQNGKAGVIDTSGNELIPIKYDSTWQYGSSSIVKVELDGKWGIQEISEQNMLPTVYDKIDIYCEYEKTDTGFAVVKRAGKVGVVNLKYQVLIPIEYDSIGVENNYNSDRSKGLYYGFHVRRKGKWGWYSIDGKTRIAPFAKNKLRVFRKNFIMEWGRNDLILMSKFKKSKTKTKDESTEYISMGRSNQLCVISDSLFTIKVVETDSSYQYFAQPYGNNTKKSERHWRLAWEQTKRAYALLSLGRDYRCGQASLYSNLTSEGDEEFMIGMDRIYHFNKSGDLWYLKANLGSSHFVTKPNKCDYDIVYKEEGQALFAVGPSGEIYSGASSGIIDIKGWGRREEEYIWKLPPQKKYQILRGNFFQNALLVQEGEHFGFVDTNLRPITSFSSQRYLQYFRWHDKAYIIHTNLDSTIKYRPQRLQELVKCSSCKLRQFVSDSAGNTLWDPKGKYRMYYDPYFFSSYERYSQDHNKKYLLDKKTENGVIIAWDSSGIGLFAPNGKALYPPLQFRYGYVQTVGQAGFLAAKDFSYDKMMWETGHGLRPPPEYFIYSYSDKRLLNIRGEEWFPGFQVKRIDIGKNAQIPTYPSDCDLGGLIRVIPAHTKGLSDNSFFMSPRGVVYADDDVLPIEVRQKR